jgi:dihydrofolate synthase/folylpolyglutamate synthase
MWTFTDAENLIFASYNRVAPTLHGYDSTTRNLGGMRQLFSEANLPLSFAPTITVTGSKGKGSTSIFCAALLQGMGHTVGLMTSPSFLSVRERIRVNGQAISGVAFTEIMAELAPTIQRIDSELPPDQYLSPTGLFLACAIRYFMNSGVTAMVLEVGRGGRFDDVSLIENQVSCFSPMMAEHLDKLGPTVTDIVWHKTGIIKPNSVAVSAPQTPNVTTQMEQVCHELSAKFQQIGRDILFEQKDGKVVIEGTIFELNTPATYQAMNLATAYNSVAALEPEKIHRPDVW